MEDSLSFFVKEFGQIGVVIAILAFAAQYFFRKYEENNKALHTKSEQIIKSLEEERDEWKKTAMENQRIVWEEQSRSLRIAEEFAKRNEDIKNIIHVVTSIQSLTSARIGGTEK